MERLNNARDDEWNKFFLSRKFLTYNLIEIEESKTVIIDQKIYPKLIGL